MTVRNLLYKLIELPLDAVVIVGVQDHDTAEWDSRLADTVVDYENGEVGIIGTTKAPEESMD